MSSIQEIFPIKIYKTNYQNINSFKEKVLPKIFKIFEESDNDFELMRDGGKSTYAITHQLHKWPECTEVVNFINSHISKYWEELNYNPSLQPYILNMWSNVNYKNGWIFKHHHGPVAIVGTLYLNISKDLGNIVLQNPIDQILGCQPINLPYPSFEYEVDLEVGDLLLFPGWLEHQSIPNKTEDPRIGISFNIGCHGKYVSEQWVTT